MASSLSTFLSSELFTFTVNGADGPQDLFIHSDVIAEISPTLKAMMRSSMAESMSKHATLDEVDFDAFNRLCQFAYRRQYTDPEPARINHSEGKSRLLTATTDDEPMCGEFQLWSSASIKEESSEALQQGKDATESLARLRHKFLLEFDALTYPTGSLPEWKPPLMSIERFDYTPVFIGHAKLYSLAKYYMCDELCNLVLHKMHVMLLGLHMREQSELDAVTKLIQHVYNDTDLVEVNGKTDELRYLVAYFAATKTREMGLDPKFVDLIAKGGSFAHLHWNLVCKGVLLSDD